MELDDIQLASQEQFARQSGRYGKGHVLENVADIAAAVRHLSLPDVADILDVATGGGHTGIYFAGLGHRVTLADIAEPMLAKAKALAQEKGFTVSTSQHSAEEMPHATGSFDLVTCRVAPHHFSSPEDFVRESARVLRPGGLFLLIDGTVEDDQPEAEEWSHQVEKLRDPSHHRLITPNRWRSLCGQAGLEIVHCELTPFKQPDLEWYFETAATPVENRRRVIELVEQAPESARRLFRIGNEDGKIVWWWQRLALVARKSGHPESG